MFMQDGYTVSKMRKTGILDAEDDSFVVNPRAECCSFCRNGST